MIGWVGGGGGGGGGGAGECARIQIQQIRTVHRTLGAGAIAVRVLTITEIIVMLIGAMRRICASTVIGRGRQALLRAKISATR